MNKIKALCKAIVGIQCIAVSWLVLKFQFALINMPWDILPQALGASAALWIVLIVDWLITADILLR